MGQMNFYDLRRVLSIRETLSLSHSILSLSLCLTLCLLPLSFTPFVTFVLYALVVSFSASLPIVSELFSPPFFRCTRPTIKMQKLFSHEEVKETTNMKYKFRSSDAITIFCHPRGIAFPNIYSTNHTTRYRVRHCLQSVPNKSQQAGQRDLIRTTDAARLTEEVLDERKFVHKFHDQT